MQGKRNAGERIIRNYSIFADEMTITVVYNEFFMELLAIRIATSPLIDVFPFFLSVCYRPGNFAVIKHIP